MPCPTPSTGSATGWDSPLPDHAREAWNLSRKPKQQGKLAKPGKAPATSQVAPAGSRAGLALAAIVGALFIACAAAYRPALDMPFYYDDRVTIIGNPKIQSGEIGEILSENPFRVIVNLTFAAQIEAHRPNADFRMLGAATHGRLVETITESDGRIGAVLVDPGTGGRIPVFIEPDRRLIFPLPPVRPFRILNLIIHAINAFLIFSIVRKMGASGTAALSAFALFLFHPLATESVNIITNRFDLMSLLFSLAAVRAHLEADTRPRADIAAAVFFVAALFCKETAALLPAAVFFIDLARKKPKAISLAGLSIAAAYFVARLQWIIVLRSENAEVLPWYRYLMVEQKVFWLYVVKIFYPVKLNFDYNVTPHGVDWVFAAINMAVLCAACFWAARALFKLVRREDPATPGPVWILLLTMAAGLALMAPTSSVIPLGDLAKEHRAYPLIAPLSAAAALFAGAITRAGRRRQKAAIAAVVSIAALLLVLASHRNHDYMNDLTLARDAMMKSPDKPRAIYNFATALRWHGRFEEAVHWYEKELELRPDNQDTRQILEVLRQKIKSGGD